MLYGVRYFHKFICCQLYVNSCFNSLFDIRIFNTRYEQILFLAWNVTLFLCSFHSSWNSSDVSVRRWSNTCLIYLYISFYDYILSYYSTNEATKRIKNIKPLPKGRLFAKYAEQCALYCKEIKYWWTYLGGTKWKMVGTLLYICE